MFYGTLVLDNVKEMEVLHFPDDEAVLQFHNKAAEAHLQVVLTHEQFRALFLEMAKMLPPEWLGEQRWRP